MADDAQIIANEIREKVERGKELIINLSAILRELPDSSVGELLGTELTDDLLKAILDPLTVKDYPSFAEFFLQNKARSTILAKIRYVITRNYRGFRITTH